MKDLIFISLPLICSFLAYLLFKRFVNKKIKELSSVVPMEFLEKTNYIKEVRYKLKVVRYLLILQAIIHLWYVWNR